MVRSGVQLQVADQQCGAETHLEGAGGLLLVDLGRCHRQTVGIHEEQADSLGTTEVVKATGLKADAPATEQGRVVGEVIGQTDLGLDGVEFFATISYSRAYRTCRQVDEGRVPRCAAQRRAI